MLDKIDNEDIFALEKSRDKEVEIEPLITLHIRTYSLQSLSINAT